MHESKCVNIFIVVEHKGNPPIITERCHMLGSRSPTNDESRPRVQGRTTNSCDSEIHF
jgi:hypothetical protein